MNVISAAMHKPPTASAEYAVLTIDGQPIYDWIKGLVFDEQGDDTTRKLVPAQVWLWDDDEAKTAWELLEPFDDSTTIVPLLVCPDDRDMACTVVVTEQCVREDLVTWSRFGLVVRLLNGITSSVKWCAAVQHAQFDRCQFEAAVGKYKSLSPAT